MAKSAYCIANNHLIAQRIIEQVQGSFRGAEISILYPAPKIGTGGRVGRSKVNEARSTTGNLSALFPKLRLITIPSLGTFFAAGTIATTLKSAHAGHEDLICAMTRLGIPVSEAQRMELKLSLGDFLIVTSLAEQDSTDEIKSLYRKSGAEDIGASYDLPLLAAV